MSSRSALLALLSLLAVAAPARADDPPALTWNDGVQSGLGFWVVEFAREDGSRAEYFVRESDWKLLEGSDAKKNGGKIPLFKLQKLQNQLVDHPYFNTQLAAYHLVADGSDRYARREGSEYKAKADHKRSQVKVKVTASSAESMLLLNETLDIVLWRESKSDQPYPVYGAFSTVVIAAPSGAPEAPPQSPVSNLAGHGSVDYGAHRGGAWRKYYERMHPVQRMLPMTGSDLNKYAYPDVYNGTMAGVQPDPAFKKAYDASMSRDHRATVSLAREGLAKAAAKARTIVDAEGPEAQLSADEMTVVMNALSAVPAAGTSPAGQARFLEMSRKANNPEKVKVFVAHWRAFIHEILHGFMEKADKATDETVFDYAAELEAVRTLAAKYFADENVDFDKWKDGERPAGEAPPEGRPAATTDAVQLGVKELAWLTMVQAREYNVALEAANKLEAPNQKRARKNALAAETRAKVADNLRPESKAKYEAESKKAGATSETIDAALPATLWGEASGASDEAKKAAAAEIALTAEELKKFTDAKAKLAEYAKNPRSLTDEQHKVQDDLAKAYDRYLNARKSADNPMHRTTYDPIVLRRTTVAARAALGLDPAGKPAARPSSPGGEPDPAKPDPMEAELTPEERERLTNGERARYDALKTDARRAQYNRKYREIVQARKDDPAYAVSDPMSVTPEKFSQMPLWHRRRFCRDFVPREAGSAAGAGDSAGRDIDNGPDAMEGARRTAGASSGARGGSLTAEQKAELQAKFGDLCNKDMPLETFPELASADQRPSVTGDVPTPTGADKEDEAKEEKKGPSDHAFNAMRGAILGALIGSLFGPLGAIIGLAIGGAAMYGVSKWKNPD